MMMENVNQHLDMPEDKTEAGLGDAEENLLWKPQNIQVQKIAPSDSAFLQMICCYIIITISVLQAHKITQLREQINTKYGEELESYQQLHQWSVQHYDKFWQEVRSRAWRIVTLI